MDRHEQQAILEDAYEHWLPATDAQLEALRQTIARLTHTHLRALPPPGFYRALLQRTSADSIPGPYTARALKWLTREHKCDLYTAHTMLCEYRRQGWLA